MFCIPYKELSEIKNKTIEMEEVSQFIDDNKKRIQISAERLYKQKNKNYQQNYLQHTVNFKKIEDAALSWEIEKYGKHSNRFPDEHYFLVNPFNNGLTEYDLMNKNKQVC